MFCGQQSELVIALLFRWHLCHCIHVRTNADYLKNGAESISRTRGIKGGLKMGDRRQEWMGMYPKVAVFE